MDLFVKIVEGTTAWKVSKYGVISGLYFPVFGLNMEICPNTGKYGPEVTLYLDNFHTVYTNADMKIY